MTEGRLQDLRAFVAGAGSGIGWEVARLLALEGARVFATSLPAPELGGRFAELEEIGVRTHPLDVRDEHAVLLAVEQAVDSLGGPLDVVSNNAGIELVHAPSVEETTPEEWGRVLDVNLSGTFRVCRAAISRMRDGGSIVNMGSTKTFVGRANAAAYAASKAGLLGFTRSLALELGSRGIRVNCVCPGTIDTPLTRQFLDAAPDAERLLATYAAKSPLGRIGTPREVANCVLFLASSESSFITGTAVLVDGGALA